MGEHHAHDHHDHAGHAHPHGHTHGPVRAKERAADRRKLQLTFVLTALIALVELVGGIVSNSLALMSDAGHVVTDLSAIGLALLALYFSSRPADVRRTYGYYRAEILSALANGIMLFGIIAFVLWEAYERFQNPEPVRLGFAAVITVIGLVANLVALFFLRHSHSLNTRGAFLHVVGDTLSSVGVLVGLGLLWLTGWEPIDPLISVAICGIIAVGAVRLVRESVDVLLEAVPAHVDLRAVKEIMLKVEGVVAVHDLHVWTISSGMYALSAHLVVQDPMVCNNDQILSAVKHQMLERFHIDHTTIQIESETFAHAGEVH